MWLREQNNVEYMLRTHVKTDWNQKGAAYFLELERRGWGDDSNFSLQQGKKKSLEELEQYEAWGFRVEDISSCNRHYFVRGELLGKTIDWLRSNACGSWRSVNPAWCTGLLPHVQDANP